MLFVLFKFAVAIFPMVGTVLLFKGLRGRLVSSKPHCRRCRFELSGLAAGAPCPECGADLAAQDAVRTGLRQARWGMVLMGVVLLLLPLSMVATAMFDGWYAPGGNARKPNWLLRLEASHSSPGMSGSAIGELASRVGTPRMSNAEAERLLARALELQADPETPWKGEWGDFIIMCHQIGVCDDATYLAFVRRAMRAEWIMRSKVRAGELFPSMLQLKNDRLGTWRAIPIQIVSTQWQLSDDGSGTLSGEYSSDLWTNGPWMFPLPIPAPEQPGEHVIRITCVLRAADVPTSVVSQSSLDWTETFERRITVVPREERTVAYQLGPPRQDILRAIEVADVIFEHPSLQRVPIQINFRSTGLPVAVAGLVRALCTLYDGREVEVDLGTIVLTAESQGGLPNNVSERMLLPDDTAITRVDVWIVPDSEPAEGRSNVDAVWMGPELVFENVLFQDLRNAPKGRRPSMLDRLNRELNRKRRAAFGGEHDGETVCIR